MGMGQKSNFGTRFTKHMAEAHYTQGTGWGAVQIVPYAPLTLDPAAKALHYGQTVFEGMKAFRTEDDRVLVFRPFDHLRRLSRSAERVCIPPIDESVVWDAIARLLRADRNEIPSELGSSLYIRPFIIATEPVLGVAPSNEYRLLVIASPVGSYYAQGTSPVRIYVEDQDVRAVRGGVGEAKTGANYVAGLQAQEAAKALGFAQVLWLDGVERRFVDEVGSMNIFFRIAGTVITPVLNGSILDGVTRKAVIRLLQEWYIPVEERPIAIDELVDAYRVGTFEEAFGTGTAAVVSPVGCLEWRGKSLIPAETAGEGLASRLYTTLTGIQRGLLPDPYGWTVEV
jgi:branched-chain amino acid aminotransferase